MAESRWVNRALRDTLMFLLGAVGFLHELIIADAERPYLLTAALALMGLPLVLRADEARNGKDGKQ